MDRWTHNIIAVIHTSEVSLKLWVGPANLYFPDRHFIVDLQKQSINEDFVGVEC